MVRVAVFVRAAPAPSFLSFCIEKINKNATNHAPSLTTSSTDDVFSWLAGERVVWRDRASARRGGVVAVAPMAADVVAATAAPPSARVVEPHAPVLPQVVSARSVPVRLAAARSSRARAVAMAYWYFFFLFFIAVNADHIDGRHSVFFFFPGSHDRRPAATHAHTEQQHSPSHRHTTHLVSAGSNTRHGQAQVLQETGR
jgi:hypothetical protein